jgi:UDP-2-acetamido-2,6-beta-L-arabino-hexul-4-ose reductase
MKHTIGITGATGFIGSYLINFLKLKEGTRVIALADEDFGSEEKLGDFVRDCDIILHFAAINRHSDDKQLHDTNIRLVRQLLGALRKEDARPHLFFSSSTQEELDNPYGRSKKAGRELMSAWATENGAQFTGLVIPNVYGPFGQPFYNSVIATFCHQLTRSATPEIKVDGELKLIHVDELARLLWDLITDLNNDHIYRVRPTAQFRVAQILEKLLNFKELYLEKDVIPPLETAFNLNLFNTFRSFIDYQGHYPRRITRHADERGIFSELVRTHTGGQFSYSSTNPGITRGNHFHTRKIERFMVIRGKAVISLRRIGTDDIISFELDGQDPAFVDIPVWHTHLIRNAGDDELITLFWINEHYDPAEPDTYFELV